MPFEEFNDELTEADLEFLNAWETMGKSDTADAEYKNSIEDKEFANVEGGGNAHGTGEGEDDRQTEIQGDEADEDAPVSEDSEAGGVEGESDSMSLDGASEQGDHLESGDSDSEIQDGESELEYDDPDFEDQDEQDRFDDETEHLENSEREAEELAQTEELPDDKTQIEEDTGEGERGNSDEARESDEPIHDSEAEEIDPELDGDLEIEQIAEEQERDYPQSQKDLDEQSGQETPKADAEHESDTMDAQQELEDRLKESEQESDDEPEQKAGEVDEPPTEAPENSKTIPNQEGAYDGIPGAGEACTNHCEDNPTEDHDGECPHCTSRITKERELWGVIATDRFGQDVYPGDKLLVELPTAFTVENAVLTANVPNQAIDPIRVAEATDGHVDTTICWLSGRISKFTGWHMQGADNSIWTFTQGKQIRFASKIGEPVPHDSHGSNADEGDQLDIDDMLRDIEKKAQENSEKEAEEAYESEAEEEETPESEEAPEDGMESDRDDSGEPDDQGRSDEDNDETDGQDSEGRSPAIPRHQKARFENLVQRITKKIEGTFGNTCESIEIEDIYETEENHICAQVSIVSRGMTFKMLFTMRRYDPSHDGKITDEDEAA